ncbi:MAG: hypothetical protein RR313_09260 [Anaerovoracaceae bacterium]
MSDSGDKIKLVNQVEYFEQLKNIEWTDWIDLEEDGSDYKTDGKTIIARYNGHLGEATCSEVDGFSLKVGVAIALGRAKIKYLRSNY